MKSTIFLFLTAVLLSFSNIAVGAERDTAKPVSGIRPAMDTGILTGAVLQPRGQECFVSAIELTIAGVGDAAVARFWISPGYRHWVGKDLQVANPYIEAGVGLLIFDVGIGYNATFSDAAYRASILSFYLGAAFPLFHSKKRKRTFPFFVAAYYRPGIILHDGYDGAVHELGVSFKYIFKKGE